MRACLRARVRECVCVGDCVRVCVRACVRACVRIYVSVCVRSCMRACVRRAVMRQRMGEIWIQIFRGTTNIIEKKHYLFNIYFKSALAGHASVPCDINPLSIGSTWSM